ncbi:MAG: SEC-C metal-binding domain-containing protein [Phycisphaerae bacterium]
MGVQQVIAKSVEKVFGSRNARLLKKLARVADAAETHEDAVRPLTDEELRAKTEEFKERLEKGDSSEDILPEVFAVLREASTRAQRHHHFHCQLVGGKVLYDGAVAEMKTGEGKTIVCHLSAYTRVLRGQKVHVVTVNDYLVKRDAEFAKPIFEMLGISVGYIQAQMDPGGHEGVRHKAYACNITYGTASEFGFDYLRDNMKVRLRDQVQGRLDFVIIDEVDSVLIDEARTPLIISGPTHDDVNRYKWADNLARYLVRKQAEFNKETAKRVAPWGNELPEEYTQNPKALDAFLRFKVDPSMCSEDEAEAIGHRQCYVVQRDRKNVSLSHDGIAVAQEEAGIGSFYIGANMDRPHLIEQALRAHVVYERDKEYVVQDREVIIVDENTGRLMYGRQWSDGLHQAVEAKEGVPVKQESQTLATITIQNFFKLYGAMSGMTGTAATEAEEFLKIYKLDVVEIPTNRPVNRVEHNDKMYRSTEHKYKAIVDEIHELRRRGRPRDPFLLADVLTALRPIVEKQGGDVAKIDEALRQFNKAEEGDQQVTDFLMETYDEAMGDLATGRPILVGTTSVENSEQISALLERSYGIEHEVLNAKNHAREAEIVVKAGHRSIPTRGSDKTPLGNVTIATNMAGRGTDIKLAEGVVYPKCKVSEESAANALYPVGATKCCMQCEEYDPATNCAHCYKPKLDPRFPALGRNVCTLNSPCGLHIIGTERHEARRIDNQLRGRSGRQGDPGSSRFFLSLEDDLLKLFMPDWMLKMMEKLGFTEGTSLEDKRLTRGIERAQRKVEERNFSSRKHLLEWDEPMDFQRKEFYAMRQRILERRDLESLIFQVIDDSITESVADFLAPDYRRRCMAEWCRSKLDLSVDARLIDVDDLEETQVNIRDHAKSEARESVRTSLVEYVDPDADPSDWDVAGLLGWAQRNHKFPYTQNQLRKMDPDDIEEALSKAAESHFDEVDLAGIEVYADESFGRTKLCEWARYKYEIELKDEELADLGLQEITEMLKTRVRQAYQKREIAYPVEQCIANAFSHADSDNAQACEVVCHWVNAKYRASWSVEQIQGRPVEQIARQLLDIQEDWLNNGKLDAEIDEAMSEHSGDALQVWAKTRFGPAFDERQLAATSPSPRQALHNMGRTMLRFELTALEQYILLRLYDQAWKDHLLEMDRLKTAIMQRPMGGDQSHPQSQYAIEGREYFDQMWALISNRVTDIIFKLRPGEGPAGAATAGQSSMQLQHADATNVGFAGAAADQQAAMKAQGAERKVETIRRDKPKVGRNAPCPCGSGKKYKQCHGRAT